MNYTKLKAVLVLATVLLVASLVWVAVSPLTYYGGVFAALSWAVLMTVAPQLQKRQWLLALLLLGGVVGNIFLRSAAPMGIVSATLAVISTRRVLAMMKPKKE